MNEFFIQKLIINSVRDIKDFSIKLDNDNRKHLILTGKNGSGKTSILEEINKLLISLLNNKFQQLNNLKRNIETHTKAQKNSLKNIERFREQIKVQGLEIERINKLKGEAKVNDPFDTQILQYQSNIKSYEQNIINENKNIKTYKNNIVNWQKQIDDFSKVNLQFSHESKVYEDILNGKFLLAYFQAKRGTTVIIPTTITKQIFAQKYMTTPDLNRTFVQYMVNKYTEKMYAKEENDNESIKKIEKWFEMFENSLKELFDEPTLNLKFYRKEFNFKIEYKNKSFSLNELSDGYSSILSILSELILRMDAKGTKAYDMQGVVLIDEIETHLHVELQKKVLPFFTTFFPKIQFIVTTHSPFVLSSLSNAIICDLEKRIITEDLSAYSYESLVDSYFDTDKYSDSVKRSILRYKELAMTDEKELKEEEKIELLQLMDFFDEIPSFQNEELKIEVNKINKILYFKTETIKEK